MEARMFKVVEIFNHLTNQIDDLAQVSDRGYKEGQIFVTGEHEVFGNVLNVMEKVSYFETLMSDTKFEEVAFLLSLDCYLNCDFFKLNHPNTYSNLFECREILISVYPELNGNWLHN